MTSNEWNPLTAPVALWQVPSAPHPNIETLEDITICSSSFIYRMTVR
ncbi:hypothetical protein L798_01036 [Zootermopsis nevadensis]|uniref:Uncharacterized protein n=1 Tax=Zootermopsis nevadensis TaxID=136037 RepID=A0A067QIB1_ZOONE|nr:hypothetical protein L798_01036 [Zootermopsis nevadensis]